MVRFKMSRGCHIWWCVR